MKNIYDLLNDVQEGTEGYENPKLNRFEKNKMKNGFRRAAGFSASRSRTRWTAAAACLVCLIGFSQTAFAKTAVSGILQTINLGHNIVYQEDPNAEPSNPEIYDKNGNLITSMPEGKSVDIYDKSGKKLGTISNGDQSDNRVTEKDLSKATAQLSFQPLLPAAMPSGYSFDCAKLYSDENGKISGDYIDLYYKNGKKQIFVQERSNTPENGTATAGTNVKQLKINGHDAALVDGGSIEWEAGKASVFIATQKNISEQDLISFAESFQQSK
ncbi:hypothetical protein CAFE_20120 [Caprobacter fermentans]|uniref:DUF4367 domain-containing protein n=1 Tax=Caproicibacter fermentans TaxID=2576756 RepID=A0A6N8HZX3_9FIRM|nr:DUF4367 domain-containing protein [Caproicibacter fermentans]MVB11302.1 hypothetical protein [Caproicibacter fermentans]QNK41892.1 DUF4367 domain-containing protein [Caproicibacter fermentans]